MMLPFGQIQLDGLLTGVGQPKQCTGISGQPTADAVTFESLLSLFGMGQIIPKATLANELIPASDAVLPGNGNEPQQTQALDSEMPFALPAAFSTDFALAHGDALPLGPDKQRATQARFAAVPPKDIATPFTMPVAQPWMVTLVHQQHVELKPGNYQVLKSHISDGNLNLEVVPKDKLAEPIKISIPLDLLQNESAAAVTKTVRPEVAIQTAARRIPLEPVTSALPELGSLIEKVNLRELQVTKAPSAPFAVASDEPVALRLIGEQVGQKIVLAAKLDKTQLKATGVSKTSTPVAMLNSKPGSTPINQPAFAGEAIFEPRQIPRSARQVAFTANAEATTEDSAMIKELLALKPQEPGTAKQFESLLANPKAISTQQTLETKAEPIAVKIALPHEMPLPKPDGRSVLLRIEPEHLGPAKLHLTLRNETLTARVTVETVQAKAAVEASLDQLTDQLARAGVKVDYIDVGVRNGGADNQFFHRQAEWFRSAKPNMARLIEEPLREIIPQVIPARPTYVGAGGVNLFA